MLVGIIEGMTLIIITILIAGTVFGLTQVIMKHLQTMEKLRQETLRAKETTKQLQTASHLDLVHEKRAELRRADPGA